MNKFSEIYRQRMRKQLAFRKWMRTWRQELGVNQTELAEAVSGGGHWVVSYWGTGKQAIPDDLINLIAEFLIDRGAPNPPKLGISDPDYDPPRGAWHLPEYIAWHKNQAAFRKWVSKTRKDVGISQTELGRRTGLSKEAISFYENGLQAIPEEMIAPIEKALLEETET